MNTRLVRIFLSCTTAVLLVPLSTVFVIEAQQRILRHRGEEILADIQSLNLRQSTFAQADRIRRKWHRWVQYEHGNDCNPTHCDFYVVLRDLSFRHQQMFERPWLSRMYEIAGGRPSLIGARLSVRDGLVWAKSFGVGVEVGTYSVDGHISYSALPPNTTFDRRIPILLEGNASTVPRIGNLSVLSRAHPDYRIWTHDRNPNLNVDFTPFASAEDVKRLSHFDLSCITRFHRCMKPEQLMPNAGQQAVTESAAYNPDDYLTECNPKVIELFSRDAQNVAIVSVVVHGTVTPARRVAPQSRLVTFRLDTRLKGTKFWDILTTRSTTFFPPGPLPYSVGTRWIVFIQGRGLAQRADVRFDPCTPLPLNDKNLDIVRRGIAQDDRPSDMTE